MSDGFISRCAMGGEGGGRQTSADIIQLDKYESVSKFVRDGKLQLNVNMPLNVKHSNSMLAFEGTSEIM